MNLFTLFVPANQPTTACIELAVICQFVYHHLMIIPIKPAHRAAANPTPSSLQTQESGLLESLLRLDFSAAEALLSQARGREHTLEPHLLHTLVAREEEAIQVLPWLAEKGFDLDEEIQVRYRAVLLPILSFSCALFLFSWPCTNDNT